MGAIFFGKNPLNAQVFLAEVDVGAPESHKLVTWRRVNADLPHELGTPAGFEQYAINLVALVKYLYRP